MGTPFLSEVKIVSFNFAPKGWALCNGQLLPINQNQALFSLLGTTYGGNGQTNFALPDLRGRVPLHFGQGIVLGQAAGEVAHTLTLQELPTHTHNMNGTSSAATANTSPGTSTMLANGSGDSIYGKAANFVALDPRACSNVGGSQPHNNMMPYLTLNFVIALQGIFPSRN